MTRALRALSIAALLLAGCAPKRIPPPAPAPPLAPTGAPPVCYDCFWEYQPESLKKDLLHTLGGKTLDDPLADAHRRILLARVTGDHGALCAARAPESAARRSRDAEHALSVAETLAFTAAECGADPGDAFREAADRSRSAGQDWKGSIYDALADGDLKPEIGEAPVIAKREPTRVGQTFVLGASKIVVRARERVGVQVERTVRDWISYQLTWSENDGAVPKDRLLTWHEGARLRDLLDAVPAKIFPLPGTLVVRKGKTWLAPDEHGTFRFAVLDDKVEYPTTLAYKNVALLPDTHGIAALVEGAVRERAKLVVGCGDTEDKMKAAYWLARQGVDVYFPCDRYVGSVVGYDAPGVLLGSAPIRREGKVAVIGDRPVTFRSDETIVVEDFTGRGELRYYDAPARYFRALTAYVPSLKLDVVGVDDSGQSSRVVERAEALGATAIGVRVASKADAAPVKAWLRASRNRRAVLFHSAPYREGYALFAEFPDQTTFGDPRPVF